MPLPVVPPPPPVPAEVQFCPTPPKNHYQVFVYPRNVKTHSVGRRMGNFHILCKIRLRGSEMEGYMVNIIPLTGGAAMNLLEDARALLRGSIYSNLAGQALLVGPSPRVR